MTSLAKEGSRIRLKETRKSMETPITSVDREESIDTGTLLRVG